MKDEVIARETLDMLHSMHERVQRLELSAGGATKLGAPTEAPEEEEEEDTGFERGFELVKDAINYFIPQEKWGVSIQPGDDEYLFTYRGKKGGSHFYVHVYIDPKGPRDDNGQPFKWLRVKRVKEGNGKIIHPRELIEKLETATDGK